MGLNPDFVAGMRDHSNATQAMLLYMQDTWNNLLKQEEVRKALDSRRATQAELLAAGYNSNPARLAGYLKRGGDGWRRLIPEETQMYIRIYASVASLDDFAPRGCLSQRVGVKCTDARSFPMTLYPFTLPVDFPGRLSSRRGLARLRWRRILPANHP